MRTGPSLAVRGTGNIAAAVALLAGASLRLAVNNVSQFSRADETSYLLGARRLAGHFWAGFPEFVADYVRTPERWVTPPPMRFLHWALIADACALSNHCGYTSLAWLSTLGGIAVLVFGWLLARDLLGTRPALVALILLVVAPLQLQLGRRALQDELACAFMLAALWATARALSTERGGLSAHLLAVLLCTLALAEKETSVLLFPALFSLWAMRHRVRGFRPRDLLFALPPLLFYLSFSLCSQSFTLLFHAAGGNLGSLADNRYALDYMSGPPDRYLIDLLIVSPIPFLLGLLAMGALLLNGDTGESAAPSDVRGARELAVMLAVACAIWACTPKDVRYFAVGAVLFHILAAWFLVALVSARGVYGRWSAPLVVAAHLCCGLWLFHRMFIVREVYDPTTFDMLRALDAVPR